MAEKRISALSGRGGWTKTPGRPDRDRQVSNLGDRRAFRMQSSSEQKRTCMAAEHHGQYKDTKDTVTRQPAECEGDNTERYVTSENAR